MSRDSSVCEFRSVDGRFGLIIPVLKMKVILEHCKHIHRLETGGILIGHYSPERDTAIVTEISGPTEDSVQGASFFWRGVKGLQRLLNRLWRHREFYIGEWHYHPSGSPIPSQEDHRQMLAFAQNELLGCPEPVLLIVGGHPTDEWFARAIVYPRNLDAVEMPAVQMGRDE
jgi:integrative and conjugative element protein (TIGR02256 family)